MTDSQRLSVYPDGTVTWDNSGIRYRYNSSGQNVLVFVDEKGGLHPLKKDGNDSYSEMFLTLAVVIKEQEMQRFIEQFHAFKHLVRPDVTPDSWEIKGKGYIKATGEQTDREDVVRMWKLFSEFLRNLDTNWRLHAVVSNREATVAGSPNFNWADKSMRHAFMRANLGTLLWNCIVLRLVESSNSHSQEYLISPSLKVHDFQMFYDRLHDKKLDNDLNEVFDFCFRQDPLVHGLIETLNINVSFGQLGFDESEPKFAGIEFTDMILFVVYRFISGKDVGGMSKDIFTSLKHYQPILHAIRQRIARSVFIGKSETSSVIRISGDLDRSFGKTLIDAMSTGIPTKIPI